MQQSEFWKENPALFIGLHLLLGTACALSFHPLLLLPLLLLWRPFWQKPLKALPYCILIFASSVYTSFVSPSRSPQQPVEGIAYCAFSQLKPQASFFRKGLQYRGTIVSFQTDQGERFHRLPCKIYQVTGSHPLADRDYLIQGTLIPRKGDFLVKPSKHSEWQAVPGTFSAAEWRYQTKEKIRSYLKQQIPHVRSGAFLSALLLGDLEDRTLALEFSHLGLQHILAISGFHFALLAAFLGFLFHLLLPRRLATLLLIFFLTFYAFFIGGASSVQRGWIALILVLVGRLLRMRTTGLNALGVGLIVALISSPVSLLDLGFQLSFLATAAILLLYPLLNRLLSFLLPKRSLSEVASMNLFDQHGYLLSACIREGLALNLSVLLFVLPILLATVHQFPLLSLLYNLFFPLWTTLVFFLLLCSILLDVIFPPLGSCLYFLTSFLTAPLLDLTAHPPALFDFSLHASSLSLSFLIPWITGVFFLGIHLKNFEGKLAKTDSHQRETKSETLSLT